MDGQRRRRQRKMQLGMVRKRREREKRKRAGEAVKKGRYGGRSDLSHVSRPRMRGLGSISWLMAVMVGTVVVIVICSGCLEFFLSFLLFAAKSGKGSFQPNAPVEAGRLFNFGLRQDSGPVVLVDPQKEQSVKRGERSETDPGWRCCSPLASRKLTWKMLDGE